MTLKCEVVGKEREERRERRKEGGRKRETCAHAHICTHTLMHTGTEHPLCARPQGCSSLSRGSSSVSPEMHRTGWTLLADLHFLHLYQSK